MYFVSRQSVEKYLRRKTGIKVSVSRSAIYFYIHYVDKNGEVEVHRVKCDSLSRLTEDMLSEFVDLYRE
jgi:hypothetical protein